jgi:hypothetical protein
VSALLLRHTVYATLDLGQGANIVLTLMAAYICLKFHFVGNKVPENMVAAEERLEILSEATIRDAES